MCSTTEAALFAREVSYRLLSRSHAHLHLINNQAPPQQTIPSHSNRISQDQTIKQHNRPSTPGRNQTRTMSSAKEAQTYTRPSAIATRSLISDTPTSPTTSEANAETTASPTSTNFYTQAIAAAEWRPSTLGRQQSWTPPTKDDVKRAHLEDLLEKHTSQHGYSSTTGAPS